MESVGNLMNIVVAMTALTTAGEVTAGTAWLAQPQNPIGRHPARPILVTCAHVVEQASARSTNGRVSLQLNTTQGRRVFEMHPDVWITHPGWETTRKTGNDVAMTWLPKYEATHDAIVIGKDMWAKRTKHAEQWLREGQPVVSLGFPVSMELGKEQKNWGVMRSGHLARVQPWLEGMEDTIVLDMTSIAGQSGSPVLSRQEGVLIGMICSSSAFKEASLSHVVTTEAIHETVDEFKRVIEDERGGNFAGIPGKEYADKLGEWREPHDTAAHRQWMKERRDEGEEGHGDARERPTGGADGHQVSDTLQPPGRPVEVPTPNAEMTKQSREKGQR